MTKNYYYDGDRLIAEKWSTGAYLLYHYDETGSPYAITYSATGGGYAKYYLIKNLQGDVLQIRNVNNTVVANYEYDAWGRVVSVKYANGNDINVSNHIGVINPIRYRGYYYDSETGFYYLKSRYYDPAICRFISTDGRIDLNDATTNLNLFAYCGNDPVNRIDSEGEFWKELKEIGKSFYEAGVAVVMVATAVAAVGGAITGTIMSGGAAAGTVPLALTLAVECLGVVGVATAAVGGTAAAVAEAGESVVEFSSRTSANQMQKQVERNQAPKGVDRVDRANSNINENKDHIHFSDGTALNFDGTPSHSGNGIPKITKPIKKWIVQNGWMLPK